MQAHLLSLTTEVPAGKTKGPDLRLGEKEKTIVAKQPVKKGSNQIKLLLMELFCRNMSVNAWQMYQYFNVFLRSQADTQGSRDQRSQECDGKNTAWSCKLFYERVLYLTTEQYLLFNHPVSLHSFVTFTTCGLRHVRRNTQGRLDRMDSNKRRWWVMITPKNSSLDSLTWHFRPFHKTQFVFLSVYVGKASRNGVKLY